MLHGWGMAGSVFDALAERLASRFQVSAPDLPGYGASPLCEPCTLESVAADVASRAPAQCFVVGWSLGAQVAIAWARAKPEQVGRLALMGGTPCFVRRADWTCAMEPEVFDAFAGGLARDPDATLARFVSLQAQDDADAKRVTRALRAAIRARAAPRLEVLREGLRLLRENDLRSLLPGVRQPALVVHGERDRLVPATAGEYLARALGNGTLATVAGAAHAPFVSHAAGVADTLMEFFA